MLRFFIFFLCAAFIHAADWPMWRHDAGRTASTSQSMPEKLDLLWSRELPPLRPAFKETRLQFDRSYEPVVAGKRLIVGSSREDCLIAFDTDTGWRIDYHLASPKLAASAKNYTVHRAKSYDSRWSDHSPVTVVYAI